MSLDVTGIFNVVQSHAMASGLFERVNTHEPKNAPGRGLSAAIWTEQISPAPGGSGLDKTSVRVALNVRLFTDMIAEPQDAIDPAMLDATSKLLDAYSKDFQLGGLARAVDLLGAYGAPLSAQAGYINQDQRLMRVITITLPVVVNDAWTQTA